MLAPAARDQHVLCSRMVAAALGNPYEPTIFSTPDEATAALGDSARWRIEVAIAAL